MSISFGGFAHSLTPMAFVRELIRCGTDQLELIGIAEAWAADMLAGAGALRRLVFSNFMFEGFGLCRNFSRAIETGAVEFEDYSHFALASRFAAAGQGLPFATVRSLLGSDLLDEPDGWSYEGSHWQVTGSLFRPRYDGSQQRADGRRRPNIIVGGVGRPRSIRLAVRYADEYNVSSSTPVEVADINARIDAACGAAGRDPSTLRRSVMAGVLIGRDESEFRSRVDAQVAMFQDDPAQATAWMDARRDRWVVGTMDAARARMAEYAGAGVDRIMLQDFIPRDLDHVALMGELIEA